MRYTLLGSSGLRVSCVALGTMTFGDDWGWGADPKECRRQFELFAEAGGTFVDTANKYTDGSAERIVGELVAPDRERFVLGTKYSLNMRHGDLNAGGTHRKNLVQSLEASLRRLGTDYVDVLWLHAWDYLTRPEEIVRALDDQVRAGKVLYVGVSDTPAWLAARMQTIAELRGWSPFVGVQVEYSLVQRDVEREILPMARELGMGVTAWAPLGTGVLTGKYDRRLPADDRPRRLGQVPERRLDIAEAVNDLAAETGVPAAHLALAWVRAKGAIPLLGARTSEQFRSNLGFLDVELTPEQIAVLDEVSAVELGWPHDFVRGADYHYGGLRDRLDLPAGRSEIG
jgi:aryl-alcohol dehydrogenase-like predicted oxidoreductase